MGGARAVGRDEPAAEIQKPDKQWCKEQTLSARVSPVGRATDAFRRPGGRQPAAGWPTTGRLVGRPA